MGNTASAVGKEHASQQQTVAAAEALARSQQLQVRVLRLLDMPRSYHVRRSKGYIVKAVNEDEQELARTYEIEGFPGYTPEGLKDTNEDIENVELAGSEGILRLETTARLIFIQVEYSTGELIGRCHIHRLDPRSSRPWPYLLSDKNGNTVNCGIELELLDGVPGRTQVVSRPSEMVPPAMQPVAQSSSQSIGARSPLSGLTGANNLFGPLTVSDTKGTVDAGHKMLLREEEDPNIPDEYGHTVHAGNLLVGLSPGDNVRITGLKDMPAYNGQMGTCLECNSVWGQWAVQIGDTQFVVKPNNLIPVDAAENEGDELGKLHVIPADAAANEGEELGELRVNVMRAWALTNNHSAYFGDVSDPYVKLKLKSQDNSKWKRTRTINNNLNPIWDSPDFTFKVYDYLDSLLLEVYDEDLLKDDVFIGRLEIPLVKVIEYDNQRLKIRDLLQDIKQGTLEVHVCFFWMIR